jgi:hypothetical protein
MTTEGAALLWAVLLLAACPGTTAEPCAGVTCAPGRTCVNGVCEPDPDQACTTEADCDYGQTCVAGQCVTLGHDLGLSDSHGGSDLPGGDAARDGLAGTDHALEGGAADVVTPDSPPPPPDTLAPDVNVGKWYQANAKNCPNFCSGLGLANTTSPEGARCMSGEVRPKSGVDQGITFTYGCWGGCAPAAGPVSSSSVGNYCYMPGQKQDNDGTDLTVGCFCL